MGVDDGVPIHYSLAEIQLRGTENGTIPLSTKTLTSAGRRHNEGVIRWNNILRNMESRNAEQKIVLDIEHELRAMDQARLTTNGIHFDSIEG